MKPILVFPSVLISFQCPYCNVTGKIKGKQPPEKDFVFRCPGCKNKVLVKLNNRGAYRKTVSIDVVYAASAVTNRTGDELHRGKIIDISITGLKIITEPQEHVKKEAADEPEEEPEKLEKPGNYVFCAFKLPGKNRSLEIRGKIVRCKPLGNDGRFDLGVAFLELNEFQAQEIGFFLM